MLAVLVGGVASVGVMDRIRVVEKERLPVPVEPQVRILVLLVDPFVELLDNVDHLAVERPEAELRGVVALGAHLFHRGEKHLPLVPVTHGVSDIHHKHIHSRVGEHRHVLSDDPFVLAQEIAHLRLAPVVGASLPVRIVSLKSGVWIGLENLSHVGVIRSRHIRKVLCVPRDVEDAHNTSLICLDRPDGIIARHGPSQRVDGHPSVLIEVNGWSFDSYVLR